MANERRTLGQWIRQRRQDELRVRQQDLAAAARVSIGYLSQLEHDDARATEPTLRRLALALSLPEFALVESARAEGVLAPRSNSRGNPSSEIVPRPLPSVPAPERSEPGGAWLTTAEAARVMGVTPSMAQHLAASGKLRPAMKIRWPGEKGPKRWLMAATAARAYQPSVVRDQTLRPPAPPGLRSLPAAAAELGLSYGSLYRRLDDGTLASIRIGRRRYVAESEIARFLAERGNPSAAGNPSVERRRDYG